MRKIFSVLILGFILTAGFAVAGENMDMPPYEGSAAFQQMKDLDGVWEGVHKTGDIEEDVTVEYEIMSNGNMVMEHLFPGTPHAMLTTYYDKGGKLNMTHYCAIGNRPQMELVNLGEPYMHSLVVTFIDPDHIIHDWGYYQDGKPAAETTKFALTRVE